MAHFGSGLIILEKNWIQFKSIVSAKGLAIQYDERPHMYEIFAVENQIVYITYIHKDTIPEVFDNTQEINDQYKLDFETNFKNTINKAISTAQILKGVAYTKDNLIRVSAEKAIEGKKLTLISPDWGDKTTWYYKSRKITNYTLTNITSDELKQQGIHKNYEGYGTWVDNFHGKYSNEEVGTNDLGEFPRLKVFVNGIQKQEVDPHTNIGDFLVDYKNARITFNQSLAENDVVSVNAWLVGSSVWSIIPNYKTKIVIDVVEVQFSDDIRIKDTIIFQVWVYNPYSLPNKMPYGQPTKYKTMRDFINESNRSYPLVYKSTAQNLGWRDLSRNLQIFVWDYQSAMEIPASVGAEIRVFLEHNEPYEGSATATFYCRVFDE